MQKPCLQNKSALRNSDMLKKHIYDFLTSDSKIEADFANALKNSTEVVVYAKLQKLLCLNPSS